MRCSSRWRSSSTLGEVDAAACPGGSDAGPACEPRFSPICSTRRRGGAAFVLVEAPRRRLSISFSASLRRSGPRRGRCRSITRSRARLQLDVLAAAGCGFSLGRAVGAAACLCSAVPESDPRRPPAKAQYRRSSARVRYPYWSHSSSTDILGCRPGVVDLPAGQSILDRAVVEPAASSIAKAAPPARKRRRLLLNSCQGRRFPPGSAGACHHVGGRPASSTSARTLSIRPWPRPCWRNSKRSARLLRGRRSGAAPPRSGRNPRRRRRSTRSSRPTAPRVASAASPPCASAAAVPARLRGRQLSAAPERPLLGACSPHPARWISSSCHRPAPGPGGEPEQRDQLAPGEKPYASSRKTLKARHVPDLASAQKQP